MKKTENFVVLAPHNDARAGVLKYNETLFKNGLKNVYPFPRVIPVASAAEPLSPDELKRTANALRKSIGKEKIFITDLTVMPVNFCGNEMNLSGYKLEPEIIFDMSSVKTAKITSCISPLILGAYFFNKNNIDVTRSLGARTEESGSAEERSHAPLIDPIKNLNIFFRAAAVANMFWKRCVSKNKEIFYKWEIEKLFWLPKEIKN
ncbi:MAG: hypothetical protein FWC21_03545 [Treponema sp.]|nr:hypothetical protein [Treponema sp.]